MSVGTLVASTVDTDGAALSFTAATAAYGDRFLNHGQELAFVKNGSGSPITVTLHIPKVIDGASPTDPEITVAAGATAPIGYLRTDVYNDSDGYAKITCSSVTSVTVAVGRVTPL